MKRMFAILGIALGVLCLTGCNYQMVDTNHTFDKAICNIGGEYQTIEVDSWRDYEGEQIQIRDKTGTVYLVSSFNCTLINE